MNYIQKLNYISQPPQQLKKIITLKKTMFFDTLATMLQKQNLSEYLFSKINMLKLNPTFKLESYIVQVINNDQISDGITNFQSKFKKLSKKGSIIRLIQWTLDLNSFDIVINDWQYLGGVGYGVKCGRSWDVQKLKIMTNSSIISKDFVVMHNLTRNNNKNKNYGQQQVFRFAVAKIKKFTQKFSINNNQVRKITKNMKNQPNLIQNRKNQIKMHRNNQEQQPAYKKILKNQTKTNTISNHETIQNFHPIPAQNHEKFQNPEFPQTTQKQSLIQNTNINTSQFLKYSQIDIRKLKITQSQPNQQVMKSLSTRQLINKRKQINSLTNNQQNIGKNSNKSMENLNQVQKLTNEDSRGRHLVFNKSQIQKLLGKQ